MKCFTIKDMLGMVFDRIKVSGDNDSVVFYANDGGKVIMHHHQECCESVTLEDVDGNLSDLCESPILQADEESNSDNPPDSWSDSHTWTFYRLGTIKGRVVLRWLGESSGYYSESVDLEYISQNA